jgi:hypothetical protein
LTDCKPQLVGVAGWIGIERKTSRLLIFRGRHPINLRERIMKIIRTAYIGGHSFEVEAEFTPEQKGDLETEFIEENLVIERVFLGTHEINQLLIEEACDLSDQIAAQVMTRIKEIIQDEG